MKQFNYPNKINTLNYKTIQDIKYKNYQFVYDNITNKNIMMI